MGIPHFGIITTYILLQLIIAITLSMADAKETWYDGFKARFKYFAELTDPRNMLLSKNEILRARDTLGDPGEQKPSAVSFILPSIST